MAGGTAASFLAGRGSNGSSTCTQVPAPGTVCTDSRPLSASTRSFEPDETRSAGYSAASVIADADHQDGVAGVELDMNNRGVSVLSRVGQRLGDHVPSDCRRGLARR
jgi:hypothetical protein